MSGNWRRGLGRYHTPSGSWWRVRAVHARPRQSR
ncbi:MAG: DUF2550 family protein [Bifidobacteriaceae bacterium]|nr:DUF2550 family protein [Bifidobacteriaceae bacterium]